MRTSRSGKGCLEKGVRRDGKRKREAKREREIEAERGAEIGPGERVKIPWSVCRAP